MFGRAAAAVLKMLGRIRRVSLFAPAQGGQATNALLAALVPEKRGQIPA